MTACNILLVALVCVSDIRAQPSLRGSMTHAPADPSVTETHVELPASDEALWVHVGHTGARFGRAHIGHTGVTWHRPGHGYHHIGHTGVSWGRHWLYAEDPADSNSVNVSTDDAEDQTSELWGHIGHTGASWGRRGVFGRRGFGHIGHTGATWGRHWLLDVNGTRFDGESVNHVDVTAAENQTSDLWGHIGHTGMRWGRHWLAADNYTDVTANSMHDESDNSTDEYAENPTDGFWVHVGHTGARWGRGPFGRRYGHIGHTGATFGHPWLLDATSAAAEDADSMPLNATEPENSFWMHVGHTGARWGRYGGGGHVGHTGATWGHSWLLNEEVPTDKSTNDATVGNADVTFMPKLNEEFWVHIQPSGASMGLGGVDVGHVGSSWGQPSVAEQFHNDTSSDVSEGMPDEFWLHVAPTGATVGMGAIVVGHTGDVYGHPSEL